MCMIEDAEPATLYNAHVVAHSRKPRKCDECQRDIAVGEKYHSASMLYDGLWDTFDTCEHCMASQRWLQGQCGGYLHGGVQLDLEEHQHELIFEKPGEKIELLRLIVGMRHQWKWVTDPNRMMPVRA